MFFDRFKILSDAPETKYTPEELVIHEQEESGEIWHDVQVSDLSRLAQMTYHGEFVRIDENDFLEYSFTSNSGKTKLSAQCYIDDDGHLVRTPHNYYPGQWRDSADDFVEKANQSFSFSREE